MSKKKDPKQLWDFFTSNIRRAIHSEGHNPVDTVRVDLTADGYLGEIGVNQLWKDSSQQEYYSVKKLSAQELKERELIFDQATAKMYINGKVADTSSFISKEQKEVAAFVMDKEGRLYINEHRITDKESFSHGSFLDDRPAEMAGMITLKDGKITMISNNSGHYKPDRLDMYRGIKKLYSQNPEAFDPKAEIRISGSEVLKLEEFIRSMENEVEGVPLHTKLRNERIKNIQNTKKQLQSIYFLDDVRNNRFEQVKNRLEQYPNLEIDQIDKIGNSALAMAIGNGNQELESYLRARSANNLGKNSIQYAVEKGNLEAMERLKAMGVDLDSCNNLEQSALHVAAQSGSNEAIKQLCLLGVKVNIKDINDETPIHYAAKKRLSEVVEILKNNKADINAKNNKGRNALHLIFIPSIESEVDVDESNENESKIVNKLIELGININEQDNHKKTPLHYLVRYRPQDLYLVDKFIEAKVNLNIKDFKGYTPLHYAACSSADDDIDYSNNSAKMFAKLLEGKPDLNVVDNLGKNPVQILDKEGMNKIAIHVYELNKDNLEKITQVMSHIIKSGSGIIKDKKENWDLIEAIINKIPENKRFEIVKECIKLIDNKSRKNKLCSFLDLSDQKKLKGGMLMPSIGNFSGNSLYSRFISKEKSKPNTIPHGVSK